MENNEDVKWKRIKKNVPRKLENSGGAAKTTRPLTEPTKRQPNKELTHDNWDEEDEPEEKGEFIKASEDQLKERKILTAKRKQKTTQSTGNPFGALNLASGFGGFGSTEVSTGNLKYKMENNKEGKKLAVDPVKDDDRTDVKVAASTLDASNNEEGKEDANMTEAVSNTTDSPVDTGKGEERNGKPSSEGETKCIKEENVPKKLENGDGAAKPTRPLTQPTKRRPDKELNHDNWDEEDEPEEKGEFIKASEDQLKERKILTAKRKQKTTQSTGNPFGAINLASGFGGFGSTGVSTGNVASMFNFASAQSLPVTVPKFDFGLTSTSKPDDKKESNGSETICASSKKLRREEADSSADPGAANSATTV